MAESEKSVGLSKDGIDQQEYALRKRLPRKLPKRKNDIYVNRQTDFKAQMARCQNLFDGGASEVYIHGLGAAVNRAINLALQIKAWGLGSIEVAANTSTVELVDDLEPETDEGEPRIQTRNSSAVHIKVFRTADSAGTSVDSDMPVVSSKGAQDKSAGLHVT